MTDRPAAAAPAADDDAVPLLTAEDDSSPAAQLYRSATRDALTGLPNRHYFREAAERALLMAARQQTPAAVLAVDIDEFDALIARHGREAGDAVLQRLGSLLEYRFRRSDLIGRLFGGTFAVLLPGAGPRQARELAESLRAAVAADAGPGDGADALNITVSVGIAVAAADNQAALDPLLDLADDGLRAARAQGRNRIAEA